MRVMVTWANEEKPREFDWHPTEFVGVAAAEVRRAFGIKSPVVRLSLNGIILEDLEPFCTQGVGGGTELEVVPIGGAV